MSCKFHKPNPWVWQCDESVWESEFEHGYSVLTTTCCDCRKMLVVKVAHAAMADNMVDPPLPILGLPEDE